MKEMQEGDPSTLADMQQKAKEMREAAARSYAEQDPDILREILRGLEKRMAATVHQWGESTGAAIYMLAMYNSADEGPKVVDAFSDNLIDFSTSTTCAAFRDEFGNYVSDTLGLYLQHRAHDAVPQVYPDRSNDYKPMLPDVGNVDTTEVPILRKLLRRYLNQLWAWQGGRGAAPYTAIAQDCLQGSWEYLDRNCLPVSVSRLQDPDAMVGLEVREWYKKIHGDSKPAVYFAKVTKADGSVLCHYTGPCLRRHPKSRLEWSANAIMFARRVEQRQSEVAPRCEMWRNLPVARSFGTFVPFTDKQRRTLRDYSNEEHDLDGLADLCTEQENLGAAHAALHSCYQYVLQVAPAPASEEGHAPIVVEPSAENISIPDFNSSISVSSAKDFDVVAEETMADMRVPASPPSQSSRTPNPLHTQKYAATVRAPQTKPRGLRKHLVSGQANRTASYRSVRDLATASHKSTRGTSFDAGHGHSNIDASSSKVSGDDGDVSSPTLGSPLRGVTQRKRTTAKHVVSHSPPLAIARPRRSI
ncbi:hypothetical protein FRC06_004908, partial [Ceratobasidium sp. 370]